MRFVSTRGGVEPKSFEDVILTGLAPDGGLFVPEQLPQFSQQEIASWAGLSYQDLALEGDDAICRWRHASAGPQNS